MYDIELNSVAKTYPGSTSPAVADVSLSVEQGSIVTLLGPSGCGKTTTLRLIAGFEQADRGSIALRGKVMSDARTWLPPEKRGVGMVFQDYALFPHLNVFNNVGFGYKAKDRRKRIGEVLELVNLTGYEKRYPHELSGGQQQRVALARALARQPVVVLLDEPFSNLDADLRAHMRVEIRRIMKETGTTAVFVSHDQKDALAISDQVVVMRDGVIQQSGTSREIYQFPCNKFVATFVGKTNLLAGTIAQDRRAVETALGSVPSPMAWSFQAGDSVYLSLRPESLIQDDLGALEGRIKSYVYTGEMIDATVETGIQDMLVQLHPQNRPSVGDMLRLRVLPEFVAVLPQ